MCVLNIFFMYYLVKSSKFGFITVRSSIANLLKFLECITESHSLSMYFTLRKGFNNFSAVFFVWVKSKGKSMSGFDELQLVLGIGQSSFGCYKSRKLAKSYE